MGGRTVRHRTDTTASPGHPRLPFSPRLAMLPAVPDTLVTELHGSATRCASQTNIDIQARRERPARASMWVGGISVALLAATGIFATIPSITDSNARSPAAVRPSAYAPAPSPSDSDDARPRDSRTQAAMAPNALSRRDRSSCPECGVVESVRQIERSADDAGVHGSVNARVNGGGSGGESGGGVSAANATTAPGYEIRIRFRDGSTTVFNKASPQACRLGSQVIVVGRSTTPIY